MVIIAKSDSHAIAYAHEIAGGDFTVALVYPRKPLANSRDQQIAVGIFADWLIVRDLNPAGIGSRCDHEIVFEPAFSVSIVDQVDTWIDALVSNLRKMRDARAPLLRIIPDEVARNSGQRLQALRDDVGSRSDQAHDQRL